MHPANAIWPRQPIASPRPGGYPKTAPASGARPLAAHRLPLQAAQSGGAGNLRGPAQSFGCSAGEGVVLDDRLKYLDTYINTLLGPYDIELKPGGGGADIGPLKPNAGLMIGLRPESARYFEYHHAETDVLENVHPRELASGSAALISLVLVLDQYGIGDE